MLNKQIKSQPKRAATDLRYGYFVPKAERESRVNDIRESHFTLGTHAQVYDTTNKQMLLSHDVQPAKYVKKSMSSSNDPLLHKGAVSSGIQSSSRIYYMENPMDAKTIEKEKKRIYEEKCYLQGSHFKFSMQENKDQWKSANNINRENQKIQTGPGENTNLKQVREKQISTNFVMDIDKKYENYKGATTISQEHYQNVQLSERASLSTVNQMENFKLAYRSYENPFETNYVKKNQPLNMKMESKQYDKNKSNHNPYSGGRSPGEKADYKSMQKICQDQVSASPQQNQREFLLQKQSYLFNKQDLSGSSVQINMSNSKPEKLPKLGLKNEDYKQIPMFSEQATISQKNLNYVNFQKDWAPQDPGKLKIKQNIMSEIRQDVLQRSFDTRQRYKISSFQKYKKPLPDLDNYNSESKNQYRNIQSETTSVAAGIDKSINRSLGHAEGIRDKFSHQNYMVQKQKLGKELLPKTIRTSESQLTIMPPLKSLEIGSQQFDQGDISYKFRSQSIADLKIPKKISPLIYKEAYQPPAFKKEPLKTSNQSYLTWIQPQVGKI